jgi:uncharacterized protein YkwD
VARNWARVLADEGALRHNPDLQEQVREHHGCCRMAENVVHNAPADVDRAHRPLLDSDGHRSNLAGDYQRIGIGLVIDDQNRLWGVQVFHGDRLRGGVAQPQTAGTTSSVTVTTLAVSGRPSRQ